MRFFENNLPAKEIPVLWNKLMQEYIGIVPENEWDGFLQDVHWSSGAFGYFHRLCYWDTKRDLNVQ